MITNLADVIQNIDDLIELKKEKLRRLFEEQKILKDEILDLEDARIKLGLELPKQEVKPEKKPKKEKLYHVQDVIKFIVLNGPVSIDDIREHFKLPRNSGLHALLPRLVNQGKVITLDGKRYVAHKEVSSV